MKPSLLNLPNGKNSTQFIQTSETLTGQLSTTKILATSCSYLTRNLNRMDPLTNSNAEWYLEVIDGLTRTIYQSIQQVFISMHLCCSWRLWQRSVLFCNKQSWPPYTHTYVRTTNISSTRTELTELTTTQIDFNTHNRSTDIWRCSRRSYLYFMNIYI